jgi:hypothetical protein
METIYSSVTIHKFFPVVQHRGGCGEGQRVIGGAEGTNAYISAAICVIVFIKMQQGITFDTRNIYSGLVRCFVFMKYGNHVI